jgi:hypothetical protein
VELVTCDRLVCFLQHTLVISEAHILLGVVQAGPGSARGNTAHFKWFHSFICCSDSDEPGKR